MRICGSAKIAATRGTGLTRRGLKECSWVYEDILNPVYDGDHTRLCIPHQNSELKGVNVATESSYI